MFHVNPLLRLGLFLLLFFVVFLLFWCIFHFPFTKKKKRGAAGAGKKNAEAPPAPRKKTFFLRFVSSKYNSVFFWIFLDFGVCFFYGHFFFLDFGVFVFLCFVSIGKVSFSAKCLFGRIGGLKHF